VPPLERQQRYAPSAVLRRISGSLEFLSGSGTPLYRTPSELQYERTKLRKQGSMKNRAHIVRLVEETPCLHREWQDHKWLSDGRTSGGGKSTTGRSER
jgi:hypothetical protein